MSDEQQTSADEAALYVIGFLILVASVITGAALLLHSVKNCTPNPYDTSLQSCHGRRHPYLAEGGAVLGGGVAQGAVLLALAAILNNVRALAARK